MLGSQGIVVKCPAAVFFFLKYCLKSMGGIAVNYGQKLITKKAGELLGECDIFAYQVKGLGNNLKPLQEILPLLSCIHK